MREERRALGNNSRHTLYQGCRNQITLAGNPAWITNDVERVIFGGVEDCAHGVANATQPAAMCVYNTLGFAR